MRNLENLEIPRWQIFRILQKWTFRKKGEWIELSSTRTVRMGAERRWKEIQDVGKVKEAELGM